MPERTLSILSVEDEPVIADRVERVCRAALGDQIAAFVRRDNDEAAFDLLERERFDLLLLDLNLRGRDGFEVLRRSVSYSGHTIIVSAHAERAAEAFEFGVVDFVVKPFDAARLEQALGRFLERSKHAGASRYLSFRRGSSTDVKPVDDVIFAKGADKYSEVHFDDGSPRLHDKTLNDLERCLSDDFMRIHKSYIVRVSAIERLLSAPGARYAVRLANGERLPVGRTRYKELRARLT